MDVIGLGTAGSKIAEQFSQYPQYANIYKIDVDCPESTNKNITCINVAKQDSLEEYEKNAPNLRKSFKKLSDEVLFVVTASGNISGMSLALLEQIKDRNVTILLVRPDPTLLSEEKKKAGRAVFGILQEYTRSGIFERMLIVDNTRAQRTLDKVSIMNFFEKINELIASTVHMTNVYYNISSIYENKIEVPPSCRIGTIGLYEMQNSENRMLFELDFPRHKRYFYCINHERLSEDQELLDTISSQMKGEATSDEVNVSFGVYSTNYDNDYVYSVWYTNKIQDWS